jgi:two-component system sensor histidine kinase KdpD
MANLPSQNRDIAWGDMVRFVRQLSHDLRNHLNAAELQSAYLSELANTSELKSEIQRLREMVAQVGTNLQHLSAALAEVNPVFISYGAAEFLSDLKHKVAHDFGSEAVKATWDVQVGDADLQIDPQLMLEAFVELFANAFQHEPAGGAPIVKACIDSDRLVFALREQKKRFDLSTEDWGHEPLRKVGQGHYGLGLNRARAIFEAHGGKLEANYDPATSTLLTTVTLPLSNERRSSSPQSSS